MLHVHWVRRVCPLAALTKAASRGDLDEVEAQLTQLATRGQGAVDKTGSNGMTALMEASAEGHLDVMRALLGRGASIDHPVGNANEYGEGCTALMIATINNRIDAAELLIQKGARIDKTDEEGKTALMHAADGEANLQDVATTLLDANAAVDLSEVEHGLTALMLAAEQGHIGMVQLLISAKCDVNYSTAIDGITYSALTMAGEEDHKETVRLLLDNGAAIPEQLKHVMPSLMESSDAWSDA